jgi:AraC-like DNA-binding protein
MPESSGQLGATVSTFYQVWIQDLHHTQKEQLLLNADKTGGVRLIWVGPRELRICYVTAQISAFRNFFVVATRDMPEVQSIEIVLKKVTTLNECGNIPSA